MLFGQEVLTSFSFSFHFGVNFTHMPGQNQGTEVSSANLLVYRYLEIIPSLATISLLYPG